MNEFLWACWDILVDSSLWMLFGFFMAGLLRAFVPSDLVARHLGRNQSGNIFKAALFGVPLPLCSCGVIPAAAGLRRQGAGKGATASFLISTPETGVDSMAASWALLDPLMTVLRPASAFLTAMVTGVLIDAADKDPVKEPGKEPGKDAAHDAGKGTLQDLRTTPDLTPLGAASACTCCSCGGAPAAQSRFRRFLDGQRFAFDDLLADIAPWFTLGILLAGVITIYLPDDLGRMLPGGGLTAMLAMLLVALPMYVCATASTPIAAALALKGFSPGALLVFLLAGPATNAATMVMVGKMLGKKSAIIYVGSIIAVTLVCAVAADALYLWLGYEVHAWLGDLGSEEGGLLSIVAALVMLAILGRALARMATQKFGLRG
ncbi:MAG: SO_0444 family Cu/Zn efflux transporter [Desulfomicrobium apsheronum]|nr:SO_0444 family Cu/Zn efflux transporter [Desulfomicrobium apsheronum]